MTNEKTSRILLNGDLTRMQLLLAPALSLDAPMGDEADGCLRDIASDPESETFIEELLERYYYEGLHTLLDQAMSRLHPDLKKMLVLRYYEQRSTHEIAELYGITDRQARERITYARKVVREGQYAKRILRYVEESQ